VFHQKKREILKSIYRVENVKKQKITTICREEAVI